MSSGEGNFTVDQQKELSNKLYHQVVSRLIDTTRGDQFLESMIPEIMSRADKKIQEIKNEITNEVIVSLVGNKCRALKTVEKLQESIRDIVYDMVLPMADWELRFVLNTTIKRQLHDRIHQIAEEVITSSLGLTWCLENNVMNLTIRVKTDGGVNQAVE